MSTDLDKVSSEPNVCRHRTLEVYMVPSLPLPCACMSYLFDILICLSLTKVCPIKSLGRKPNFEPIFTKFGDRKACTVHTDRVPNVAVTKDRRRL